MVSRLRLAVICGLLGGGIAAADGVPELEFLEYLGSWEESDEDWLLFNEVESAEAKASDERSDPVPAGEESTETDDES
ncbi:MAG: hypothetical protein OEV63_15790 [Gammaproteobacteria bacterium]|nr:hypothetical protein [Gammaproteobacteria bacterium]MDH5499741.1 hypothetical protein [Gammaproteobacteria bacterium]